MKRLGYAKYVAQGGDWGDPISEQMALLAPSEVLDVHSNMPAAVPPDIMKALHAGGPPPTGLSDEEKHAYDQLDFFFKKGLAYAQEMGNRPQTLYAIEDSPVGLAAWILDHDARSYALIARVFDGQTEGLTRDDVLDNITLYWVNEHRTCTSVTMSVSSGNSSAPLCMNSTCRRARWTRTASTCSRGSLTCDFHWRKTATRPSRSGLAGNS